MTAARVRGAYYDGTSSRRHEVALEIAGRALHIAGTDIDLSVPLAEVRVEERVASAPRLLQLPRGAMVESADLAGVDEMLEAAGYRDSAVVRWQGNWRFVLGSLLGVIGVGIAFYVWGLPWASDRIAASIPPAWGEKLGREALGSLRPPLFQASALSPEQKSAIERDFASTVRKLGYAPPALEFRRFAGGPNAFALPGNTIVMTDELVKLAARTKDPAAAILGVLGHEFGHLRHRHPLRQFVRGTVLSALAAWWLGDISTVLATAAPALLAARYSRDFEREADREAVRLLHSASRSTEPLIELFGLLERGGKGKQSEAGDGIGEYFSSHPGTVERIRILRGAEG